MPKQASHTTPTPTHRRINVTVGPHEKRLLITGLHTVADIYCLDCEVRGLVYVVTLMMKEEEEKVEPWRCLKY